MRMTSESQTRASSMRKISLMVQIQWVAIDARLARVEGLTKFKTVFLTLSCTAATYSSLPMWPLARASWSRILPLVPRM